MLTVALIIITLIFCTAFLGYVYRSASRAREALARTRYKIKLERQLRRR